MSRKPAASSGDGAAGRSLFRSCKQPTKASSRQESDQLTRQNQLQPASGAELDADRLDGPASNLGGDLALAPVTDPRELYGVGNLVPPLSEPHGVGNLVPPLSEPCDRAGREPLTLRDGAKRGGQTIWPWRATRLWLFEYR